VSADVARALAEWLFASGYRFFLPYLALYLGAWLVDAPVEGLKRAFVALHACNLALLILFVWGRRRAIRTREALFWAALVLVFLVPGAYLEYPSDVWEHLRRIYHWLHVDVVDDHDTARWKFAYFWGYSLLFWVPPLERRSFLDLYSALWQTLVAIQIYALSRRLGFDATWSKLQVIAFVLLFGEGPFGIRYLALSSTPLAYAAFLRTLVCWIDLLDGRNRRAWRELPALFALALVNHRQEGIFILMGTAALLLVAWLQSLTPATRRLAARAAGILLVLCLAGGALAREYVPELYHPAYLWQISWLGGFRIWQRWYFLDTYGVHGVVSLLFALALLRRDPRLALLTLMPTLVLLLPPTTALLSHLFGRVGGPPVVHRMLLGFPTSLMLVQGLRELWSKMLRDPSAPAARRRTLICTGVVLTAFAASPFYPWAGRLYFQLHRPDPDLCLRFVDETAEWFMRHRSLRPSCRILSDAASQFGLHAQLGWPASMIAIDRLRPPREAWNIRTRAALLALVREQPICGILVGIRGRLPRVAPSPISTISRAWDHRFASPDWLTSDGFRSAAEGLTRLGWTRTPVPPWYLLYEPPGAAGETGGGGSRSSTCTQRRSPRARGGLGSGRTRARPSRSQASTVE